MRSLHVILIILASFVIGAFAGMHSSRFQVLSVDFTWEPGGHTFEPGDPPDDFVRWNLPDPPKDLSLYIYYEGNFHLLYDGTAGSMTEIPGILDPHNSKKPNDIWVKMQK